MSQDSVFYVESEFAPLKKVVLSQSEMTICKVFLADSYDAKKLINKGVLKGSELFYFINSDEGRLNKMRKERESLRNILVSYGIEVLMPRLLTEEEKERARFPDGLTGGEGLSNLFARDPFCVIGNHLIEMNIRKAYRRKELLMMEDILGDAKRISMPSIEISKENGGNRGPFLEGGDILVYNKTIYVGNSGYGSDSAGINWLREYLKNDGYEVQEIRLKGDILHLDCAISFVRDGLMIVCPELFLDGIPKKLKKWDKVIVSIEDAEKLAVNGMAINEDVYICDIAFKNTIGKELESRGINVEYIDFQETRAHGGSIRCSLNPLVRF